MAHILHTSKTSGSRATIITGHNSLTSTCPCSTYMHTNSLVNLHLVWEHFNCCATCVPISPKFERQYQHHPKTPRTIPTGILGDSRDRPKDQRKRDRGPADSAEAARFLCRSSFLRPFQDPKLTWSYPCGLRPSQDHRPWNQ